MEGSNGEKYDKQSWKVATKTNMTNKTDSNMDWESQFETIWSKKIRFWGKSYVTAVVFGANGHFSEPAYSVKRLSLLLKINPYRLLNWDTKTSFGWVNSSSSPAVRVLSSHHDIMKTSWLFLTSTFSWWSIWRRGNNSVCVCQVCEEADISYWEFFEVWGETVERWNLVFWQREKF